MPHLETPETATDRQSAEPLDSLRRPWLFAKGAKQHHTNTFWRLKCTECKKNVPCCFRKLIASRKKLSCDALRRLKGATSEIVRGVPPRPLWVSDRKGHESLILAHLFLRTGKSRGREKRSEKRSPSRKQSHTPFKSHHNTTQHRHVPGRDRTSGCSDTQHQRSQVLFQSARRRLESVLELDRS